MKPRKSAQKKNPPKLITLKKLSALVKKDRKFFIDVIKNPRVALKEKHLTLSPRDLRKLHQWLRRRHCKSGRKMALILLRVEKPDDWPQSS